jgi:ABC-type multidrug transport system fused ATPase/permease subunit
MFWLSPVLAVVMVAIVPLFIWVAARLRAKAFPATYTDALFKASVAGIVEEAVTGVRVVKAFGQEAQKEESLPMAEFLRRGRPLGLAKTSRTARHQNSQGVWA